MAQNPGADGAGPSSSAVDRSPAFRFAFLQFLMQRGYMLDSDAKALYKRLCGVNTDAGYFFFIRDINKGLDYANFTLRRMKYPCDQQEYIGFINREADEDSKRAGKYRGKDGKPDVRLTAFFRALLERIATEDPGEADRLGSITSGEALNLSVSLEAMTQHGATQAEGSTQATQAAFLRELSMREREAALAQFVADGWLAGAPGRAGCYTLGVRSLLELNDYIISLELPEATKALLGNI